MVFLILSKDNKFYIIYSRKLSDLMSYWIICIPQSDNFPIKEMHLIYLFMHTLRSVKSVQYYPLETSSFSTSKFYSIYGYLFEVSCPCLFHQFVYPELEQTLQIEWINKYSNLNVSAPQIYLNVKIKRNMINNYPLLRTFFWKSSALLYPCSKVPSKDVN